MDLSGITINQLRQLLYMQFYEEDEDGSDSEEETPMNVEPGEEPRERPTDLLHTPLHEKILASTGAGPGVPNTSIFQMVQKRQFGQPCFSLGGAHFCHVLPHNSFSEASKAHITQRWIPNQESKLDKHHDYVFSGTYSGDGDMLMTACKDTQLRLYDTNNWKKLKTIRARDVGWSIISTDFSHDSQWVIYSSWSSYVHMCNTSGPQIHEALDMKPGNHRFCLFSIQFSQDSREIIGGSSDFHIYIYDLERKERISRIESHDEDVNAVTFADKSCQTIFSGSDDHLIKIWDRRTMQNGGCVGVLQGHTRGITYIDSKQDGRHLISNGKDQTCKLWDIRQMRNPTEVPQRRGIWNQRRAHVPDGSLLTFRGHIVSNTLIRCRFSPVHSTGQRYIYTGSSSGSVYVFDTLTGETLSQLSGHGSIVRDAHWHPYKPQMVTSGWDGIVLKWEWDEDKFKLQQARRLEDAETEGDEQDED